MSKWEKRRKRASLKMKSFWNKYLRPWAEPVLKAKVAAEIQRAKRKLED